MLNGDRRRLELTYSLTLTLPGTPVIRYGDEIGMGDDLSLPERSSARTPMPWSSELGAGFTINPKPILPPVKGMRYDWRDSSVLFMHNLSTEPLQVRFTPGVEHQYDGTLVNLLSDNHSKVEKDQQHSVLFEPYRYRWFRVGHMDQLLRRGQTISSTNPGQ